MYRNLELNDLMINGEVEQWIRLNEVEGLEMFRELYWVSSFGRVKSVGGCKGDRILKQSNDKDGYLHVGLRTSNSKQKMMRVHRLVALAFVSGWSEERNTVDHIFPDTKNNMASNLQWLSIGDNTRKEQSMPVIGTCVKTGEVVKFSSTKEAGRNGFDQGNVAKACRGKLSSNCKHGGTNIFKGFKWKYRKEENVND